MKTPAEVVQVATDKALALNRPVVLNHLRRLGRNRPEASPAELLRSVERHYLATVTASGGVAGGSSAVPGISTPASVVINVAEIPFFVEATALLALSYAEIHGVRIEDLERRCTLIYAVLLGQSGTTTVARMAGRTGKHWGRLLVGAIDRNTILAVNKVLGRNFVTKFGTKQGILVLGRQIPMGIGAAIGTGGNAGFGYVSIPAARRAFGAPPATFPPDLRPEGPDTETSVNDDTNGQKAPDSMTGTWSGEAGLGTTSR